MTKNDLMLAAAAIAGGFAYRAGSDCYYGNFYEGVREVAGYTQLAADMVEVAQDYTLIKIASINESVYDSFGDWYCTYGSENDQVPAKEVCHNMLAELVYDAFYSELTEEQEDILKRKLSEVE